MLSKATFSRSTLVLRLLAVVLFVGYFAARYEEYAMIVRISPFFRPRPAAEVITGIYCNPIYFYCLGLWLLAGVFGRMKRGEAFTPAVLSGLKALAVCLILAGISGLLVFPVIGALATGRPLSAYYGAHGTDLIVCLLGVVLLAVSRRGQRLRGELEQFV